MLSPSQSCPSPSLSRRSRVVFQVQVGVGGGRRAGEACPTPARLHPSARRRSGPWRRFASPAVAGQRHVAAASPFNHGGASPQLAAAAEAAARRRSESESALAHRSSPCFRRLRFAPVWYPSCPPALRGPGNVLRRSGVGAFSCCGGGPLSLPCGASTRPAPGRPTESAGGPGSACVVWRLVISPDSGASPPSRQVAARRRGLLLRWPHRFAQRRRRQSLSSLKKS